MNTKALSIPSLRPKTRATAEAWGEKGHSYKPLPIRFRRDGFDYRQIAREGDAAMYEQRWSGPSNTSVCYEVIRIRRRKGFQIDGRFVEPAEVYPNSEAWGVDGFTLTDKDAAFAKLKEGARGSNTSVEVNTAVQTGIVISQEKRMALIAQRERILKAAAATT